MQARSSDLSTIARLLAISAGNPAQAAFLAESTKVGESIRTVLRAAADAGSTTDPAFAAALADSGIVAAFVEALRSRSVFGRLLSDGMVRMPLRTNAAILIANASSYIVAQGNPVPISAMSLAGSQLDERKAAALIVATAELIRSTSPAGRALLDDALRSAVGDALDTAFVDLVTDGLTPIAATGTTPSAALADLRTLLDLVNTTGSGSLYFVMGPDTANRAATLAGSDGSLTFPAMGPGGGELLNTPTLISSAVLSGQIVLLDASGIAGELESVTISLSDQASVQMDTAPNAPPNAASVATSLWQTNRVALLARAFFGAEVIRLGSVAILDGVEWGD